MGGLKPKKDDSGIRGKVVSGSGVASCDTGLGAGKRPLNPFKAGSGAVDREMVEGFRRVSMASGDGRVRSSKAGVRDFDKIKDGYEKYNENSRMLQLLQAYRQERSANAENLKIYKKTKGLLKDSYGLKADGVEKNRQAKSNFWSGAVGGGVGAVGHKEEALWDRNVARDVLEEAAAKWDKTIVGGLVEEEEISLLGVEGRGEEGRGEEGGGGRFGYPRHQILPYKDIEVVILPNGQYAKIAYGNVYDASIEDLEIELSEIRTLENKIKKHKGTIGDSVKLSDGGGGGGGGGGGLGVADSKDSLICKMKVHYKNCISIISPWIGDGWNRWSEAILDLFLFDKLHKVCWGSGNCGKSVIFAVLLYIKWRVNPEGRMVVIASKVVKDASARVFGYIKDIHLGAPRSEMHKFKIMDSASSKGIFVQVMDKESGRWVNDDRACIVSFPIKVTASNAEYGSNLLGKHPDDLLVLAFDEAQELPGRMLSDKIFLNWYTNTHVEIFAWGNPVPVDYNNPVDWDLLFKVGAGNLSRKSLRDKERVSDRTCVWGWSDTIVLHLSMLDSPKDDPDEVSCLVKRADGVKLQRLHFLAGKDNVERIAEKTSNLSASWYSQVLGFPYIDDDKSQEFTVLNPAMVRASSEMPLVWRHEVVRQRGVGVSGMGSGVGVGVGVGGMGSGVGGGVGGEEFSWFMGVDPSVSGSGRGGDKFVIVVGRMGMMSDGRWGVDLMSGKYCQEVIVSADGSTDINDEAVRVMYRISREVGMSLNNIGIETHGTGEVMRYALDKAIAEGILCPEWTQEVKYMGANYLTVSPMGAVSSRPLFRTPGHIVPANDMISNKTTEYWVAVRCAVITKQMFNIPFVILKDFYNRRLKMGSGGGGANKYIVEPKPEYSKRGLGSPDYGDALANMFQVARVRGGFSYRMPDSIGEKLFGKVDPWTRAERYENELKTGRAFSVVGKLLGFGSGIGGSRGVGGSRGGGFFV